MAKQLPTAEETTWEQLQELFEHGDPSFVDELRRCTDAERMGKFAATWLRDRRPASRRLLLEYLRQPLNAFRHEALVKRLFKRAEAAGDDEVMAHFMVLFDRSLRHVRKDLRRHQQRSAKTAAEAKALVARWEDEGYENVFSWKSGKRWQVAGERLEEAYRLPVGTTMWRPDKNKLKKPCPISAGRREDVEARCRLFSPATRKYLRRRAWRYFRHVGKVQPSRYVKAVSAALKLYEDDDVRDGVALLDNWGLVHALFHHCPALEPNAGGWRIVKRHTLAELAPAPYFEPLWKEAPQALLAVMKEARCRPVRQWATFLLRRDHADLLERLSLEELFGLLGHEAEEVVELAADLLRRLPGLEELSVERWLDLLETANPQALDVLCGLIGEKLHPERVTLEQAAHLAASRPLPVARLGFGWLRSRTPATEADCRALLALADARAEPLRPEVVGWARGVLSASPLFRPEWVLEYLDSRHADVRGAGWQWLLEEPRAADDVVVWQRLTESPYDDVRLLLVAHLEDRAARGDAAASDARPLGPELLRLLWATVLLNIHRGGRVKPLALRQVVRRLGRRPEEAGLLLPLLAVALRSVRGPEWRAGLAGVVQLLERNPVLAPAVREAFPELEWSEGETVTSA